MTSAVHACDPCSRFRRIAGICVWLAVALVAVQFWILDGLVFPYRIAGGSMAETLMGGHCDVVCADCGTSFFCDAEARGPRRRAVCPNCGFTDNDLESQAILPGDVVWVDRASFRVRRPRRWELAALRRSSQADEVVVKRVVGLPGESVQIRDGDVYVDGCIQRKGSAQQRAMALLVHDAGHQPSIETAPSPRWRAEAENTHWEAAGGRFVHRAAVETEPIDWLVYHHERRLPGGEGKVEATPVTDLYGYNPSRPRREDDVHPVADLLLSVRLDHVSGRGSLVFRATDGATQFESQIHPAGAGHDPDGTQPYFQVFRDGLPAADGAMPCGFKLPMTIEISLVDQQFLLAFDGETAAALPFERCGPARPPATPLAIGVRGLNVALTDLRVYRDVYYTWPIGLAGRWGLAEPVRLGNDEYFVLGDNSPISEDSRTWSERGEVASKLLLGKPLVVPFGHSSLRLGPWHFQVPNPAGMRYIR